VRSGPSAKGFPKVSEVINGQVVDVIGKVTNSEGYEYYKIIYYTEMGNGQLIENEGFVYHEALAATCNATAHEVTAFEKRFLEFQEAWNVESQPSKMYSLDENSDSQTQVFSTKAFPQANDPQGKDWCRISITVSRHEYINGELAAVETKDVLFDAENYVASLSDEDTLYSPIRMSNGGTLIDDFITFNSRTPVQNCRTQIQNGYTAPDGVTPFCSDLLRTIPLINEYDKVKAMSKAASDLITYCKTSE